MSTKGNLSNPTGPHLNERLFRRFEDTLQSFFDSPSGLTVTVTKITARSFVQTARQAINAFLQHRYTSTIPYDEFLTLWQNSQIRAVSPTEVQFGPKGQRAVPLTTDSGPSSAYAFEITNPTEEQIVAATSAIRTGLTTLPIHLLGQLPTNTHDLISPYAILQPLPDGTYILI